MTNATYYVFVLNKWNTKVIGCKEKRIFPNACIYDPCAREKKSRKTTWGEHVSKFVNNVNSYENI